MKVRTRSAAAVVALLLAASLASCADDGSEEPTSASTSADPGLSLVVIGDSIPMNDLGDCPGCKGFVQQYADAAEAALGRPVTVTNLAQHTNLTLPQLLDELPGVTDQLSAADLILVGIAHNSFPLNADEPCGVPLDGGNPDWSAVTPECGEQSAAEFADDYDQLFSQVAAMREGDPTVLRTINRYDDWRGTPGIPAADTDKAAALTDAWDAMLCDAATAHDFTCVDLHAAMNGPDGTQSAMPLLTDGVHPNQQGMDAIAAALLDAGFAPLG